VSKIDEKKWLTDQYWFTPYNFDPDVRKNFDLPERVYFHDVTLREAEQSPHVSMLPQEKVEIAKRLDLLGVDSIEVAPFYSSWDTEATKELTKMRREGKLNAKVLALCRWVEADVDLALECGVDGVCCEGSTNTEFTKTAWGLDEKQLADKFAAITKYAKSHKLFVVSEPWDTYRSPISTIERVVKSVVFEGGADHVMISDSFGMALPWTIAHMVKKVRGWIPGIPIEHHAHNDFGLATMVMVAAVTGGASVVQTSINCLGERAGNASTEEVAVALQLLLGVETGLHLEHLYPTCEFVSEVSKVPIPRNKAIVGENEFTITSSMVAWMLNAVAKSKLAFQGMIFAPELIGRKRTDIISTTVLGRGTGAFVVEERLKKLGLTATKEQVNEIVELVKTEAGIRKSSVPEVAFENIVNQVINGK
jgi:2-isopropylmalate synthase